MKIGIVAITEPGYSNPVEQKKQIERLSVNDFAGKGETPHRVGDRRSGYGQLYCWQIPNELPEKFHQMFLRAKAYDLRIDRDSEHVEIKFVEV